MSHTRAEIVALRALPAVVRERLFTIGGPGWAVFDEEDVHAGWLTQVEPVIDSGLSRGAKGDFLPASEGALLDLANEMADTDRVAFADNFAWMERDATGRARWRAAVHMRRGPGLDAPGTTAREACLLLLGKLAVFLDRPTDPRT